jgi:predicted TIM-barrel fold metal-dependent hydrolase
MSGGWDCHAHVFGPYARYPLAAERSYTPPEAPAADYLALLAGLGLTHGVLVHPSAYGEDFSLLLDTLAAHPQLRGVVVVGQQQGARLAGLQARGVRGARFSHRSGAASNFAGSASFQDLLALAPKLADEGLHAELWTDCKVLTDIADRLRALPVPVVIDHMGGFDVDAGLDDAGFRSLLSLVEGGFVHVKLCAYRNLLGRTPQDAERGRAFHQALVEANPVAMLWGTDWPHLRVQPVPETAALLAQFERWTGDAARVSRILVDNPAALYA